MLNESSSTRRGPGRRGRFGWSAIAVACMVVASGCATKADVRDLQNIVAESSRQQADIFAQLERSLALTADSLQRGQSQGRVELQGTVLSRLNEISARLDRLESLMGFVSDEVQTLREDVRELETRPVPTQMMPPAGEERGGASGFPGEQSADQLISQALEDYQNGSFATAMMEYEAFIEDFPGDLRVAEARYRRALILRETEDPEVALTAFQEIPQLHPDSEQVPLAQWEIADLHIEMGDPGDARDVLRRMIATYPDHALNALAERRLREIGGDPTARPEV